MRIKSVLLYSCSNMAAVSKRWNTVVNVFICIVSTTACGGPDVKGGQDEVRRPGETRIEGGPCQSDGDCINDMFCDVDTGTCLGFQEGEDHGEACVGIEPVDDFRPSIQCEFTDPPAGDPFPSHVLVLATPIVADFGIDADPGTPPQPSIVAVFDKGQDGGAELPTGVIRILDGATCKQQAQLGELQLVSHSSPVAVAELGNGGAPEIVAFKAGGGLVAFTYSTTSSTWEVLWRSSTPAGAAYNFTEVAGGSWAGPSIHDLDHDGTPEILRGPVVFDANGVLLDNSLLGKLSVPSRGVFTVVADVDSDGKTELITGGPIYEWAPGEGWELETYSPGGGAIGHVGVAEFVERTDVNDWATRRSRSCGGWQ